MTSVDGNVPDRSKRFVTENAKIDFSGLPPYVRKVASIPGVPGYDKPVVPLMIESAYLVMVGEVGALDSVRTSLEADIGVPVRREFGVRGKHNGNWMVASNPTKFEPRYDITTDAGSRVASMLILKNLSMLLLEDVRLVFSDFPFEAVRIGFKREPAGHVSGVEYSYGFTVNHPELLHPLINHLYQPGDELSIVPKQIEPRRADQARG